MKEKKIIYQDIPELLALRLRGLVQQLVELITLGLLRLLPGQGGAEQGQRLA